MIVHSRAIHDKLFSLKFSPKRLSLRTVLALAAAQFLASQFELAAKVLATDLLAAALNDLLASLGLPRGATLMLRALLSLRRRL